MQIKEQREYWDKMAEAGIDAAVVDRNDTLGYKNRYIIELRTAVLLRELVLNRAHRVLDFGCGTGNLSRALTRYGLEPVGVDISHKLLMAGMQVAERSPWLAVRYDGHRLPFAATSFDAVTTYVVLNYLVDDAHLTELLLEFYRILKPGGILLAAEQVTRVARLSADSSKLQRPPPAFGELFEKAGFEIESQRTFRFGHFPLLYLIRYGCVPKSSWRTIARLESWCGRIWPQPLWDYADRLFVVRRPRTAS